MTTAVAVPPARMATSDEELVRTAKAGDTRAFEELVRRHTPQIYRMLVRRLGDAALAEDETQEAFVRAWRALPRFRGEAAFSTWLVRIALNGGKRTRAREARRGAVALDELTFEPADRSGDPADLAASREALADLERFLGDLPEHYRAPVVLRDVEGLTNQEAAELLGLGLRNLKSRLHRGRMALRSRLEAAQAA